MSDLDIKKDANTIDKPWASGINEKTTHVKSNFNILEKTASFISGG